MKSTCNLHATYHTFQTYTAIEDVHSLTYLSTSTNATPPDNAKIIYQMPPTSAADMSAERWKYQRRVDMWLEVQQGRRTAQPPPCTAPLPTMRCGSGLAALRSVLTRCSGPRHTLQDQPEL